MSTHMKSVGLVILLGILIPACSSTYRLVSVDNGNDRIGESPATVRLTNGEVQEVEQTDFTRDSAYFLVRQTGMRRGVMIRSIQSIEITDHWAGAQVGLQVGAGAGAALGVASFLPKPSHQGWYAPPFGPEAAVLGGIAIGTTTGIIIGALIGHRYTFLMPQDSTVIEPPISNSNLRDDP